MRGLADFFAAIALSDGGVCVVVVHGSCARDLQSRPGQRGCGVRFLGRSGKEGLTLPPPLSRLLRLDIRCLDHGPPASDLGSHLGCQCIAAAGADRVGASSR